MTTANQLKTEIQLNPETSGIPKTPQTVDII
jgi:hypothetical protein